MKLSIPLSLAPLFRCLGTLSFLFLKVLPTVVWSTCIGSGASLDCSLMFFIDVYEGWDGFLSAFNRVTTIIWKFHLVPERCSSINNWSWLSIAGWFSPSIGDLLASMFTINGLGGWGFLAVNSSWVRILTVSHDATDSVDRWWIEGIDQCLYVSIDRCSTHGFGRRQCDLPKLIELST